MMMKPVILHSKPKPVPVMVMPTKSAVPDGANLPPMPPKPEVLSSHAPSINKLLNRPVLPIQKLKVSKVIKAAEPQQSKPKKVKDPNAPKHAMSAYLYYSRDERVRIKLQNPSTSSMEILQECGARWKALTEEERAPFLAMATKDKERFEREKALYTTSTPTTAATATTTPICSPKEEDEEDEMKNVAPPPPSEKKKKTKKATKKTGATTRKSGAKKRRISTAATTATIDDDDDDDGDGDVRAEKAGEEDDDEGGELREVDWTQDRIVAVLSHLPEKKGGYVVMVEGQGYDGVGIYDPKVHPEGGGKVTPALIDEYYTSVEKFRRAVEKATVGGSVLDLEGVGEDPELAPLEMCSFLGHMRNTSMPLEQHGRATRSNLFKFDPVLQIPLFGLSFLTQRLIQVERTLRQRAEDRVRVLQAKLDQMRSDG